MQLRDRSGINRVGFYGGSGAIGRVLDAGKATKAWQTSSFPGIVDPRISLYQYAHDVTIAGGNCDKNHGYGTDLGQWSVPPPYTITASALPGAGGTVSGGGTFASGSSKSVTATANSGYTA